MTDLTAKKLAGEYAFEALKELSIRSTAEPYNIYDALPTVLERIKRVVEENETKLDEVLTPIVEGAIRDADRRICDPKADRTRHFQIGQLPIFVDLDLDATLALGGNERIRIGSSRVDHIKRSFRLDTENVIAVNAAFAVKHAWKQPLIDVMEPLDPRTTVKDVVSEQEDEQA